jgi:tRNA(Ile)-lysidine synthase
MMYDDKFIHNLAAEITANHWLDGTENQKWLIAVSGGVDSMALLAALTTLQKEKPSLLPLHVIHVNHQLRGDESDKDAAFVQNWCETHLIDFTIETTNIQKIAEEHKTSIETAARDIRYQLYAKVALAHQCTKVALAHHQSDQVETVLHRIIRGTGLRGLAGIPIMRPLHEGEKQMPNGFEKQKPNAKQIFVIRPLLHMPRADIETYLTENQIPFRNDSSNDSNDYTRNQIRNELIPYLKKTFNPAVEKAISRLSQTCQRVTDMLSVDAQTHLTAVTIEATEHAISLNAEALNRLPIITCTEILYLVTIQLRIPQRKIGFKQIDRMITLLKSDHPGKIQCPYQMSAQRTMNTFIIKKEMATKKITITQSTQTINIAKHGYTVVPISIKVYQPTGSPAYIKAVLTTDIYLTESERTTYYANKPPLEELLDNDQIKGDIALTITQNGDRFTPIGAKGAIKVGDFFTNNKLPLIERHQIGLIKDDQGIIIIAGMRMADRVRITEATTHLTKVQFLLR